MFPRLGRHPLVLAGVFAIYLGLAKLGVMLADLNASTGAIWLPSGFALAAALLLGRRIWPAILVGAWTAHATTTGDVLASFVIAGGDTLEVIVGATLIDRFAAGADVFKVPRTALRFVVIAAFATLISASVAVTTLTLSGAAAWYEFVYVWMIWWLGHLTGNLVVAPFILLWAAMPIGRVRWREVCELLGLFTLLVIVGLMVFGGRFPSDVQDYPLQFLCVPLFLWAAFRFGRREVATAVVVLSGIAVWGTFSGFGPFARDTGNESLVLVQAYAGVISVMGFVLAAVVAQFRDAEQQLRGIATTDALTGLANYRRLLDVLRAEIARSRRTLRPFAVLFLDMNGLKRINDRHGHLAGSRALCRLARALVETCRTTDTPTRFGGDEFAVVLTETAEVGGRQVLRRLSERLANDPAKPAVSVSGGIAVFPRDGETPTILLRAADQALHQAKAERRMRAKVPAPVGEKLF